MSTGVRANSVSTFGRLKATTSWYLPANFVCLLGIRVQRLPKLGHDAEHFREVVCVDVFQPTVVPLLQRGPVDNWLVRQCLIFEQVRHSVHAESVQPHRQPESHHVLQRLSAESD